MERFKFSLYYLMNFSLTVIQLTALLLPWIGVYSLVKLSVVKVDSLNIIDSLKLISCKLSGYYFIALISISTYASSIALSLLVKCRLCGYLSEVLALITLLLWTAATCSVICVVKDLVPPGTPPFKPIVFNPYQPDIGAYITGLCGFIRLIIVKLQQQTSKGSFPT